MCAVVQGALLDSHMVLTVSPSYAEEVMHDDVLGCGMQRILAAKGVRYAYDSENLSLVVLSPLLVLGSGTRGSSLHWLCAVLHRCPTAPDDALLTQ